MISCLMPTIPERKELAFKSIGYFLEQDYEDKELLILTSEPVFFNEIFNEKIRIIKSEQTDLQNKIRLGLSKAQGNIIARWDDDDIQSNNRLSKEYSYLNAYKGVYLNHGIFYDHDIKKYFYNPSDNKNMWDSSAMFFKENYGKHTRDINHFKAIDDLSIIVFGLDKHSMLNSQLEKNRYKLWPYQAIKA